MTSLNSNLIKRVQRLPKPARTSDALQPLFEAVSNSIHAIYARWGDKSAETGKVEIFIELSRSKENIEITVDDNGIGLDSNNYESFLTTDSDHKISFGGKRVGRLLWLDCFPSISVESYFLDGNSRFCRSFTFHLSNNDQVRDYDLEEAASDTEIGTVITFRGLRDNGYLQKFPGRQTCIFQHLFSHFLPIFVAGRSPRIVVTCGDDQRIYPDDINEHISRQSEENGSLESCGMFKVTMIECHKSASSSLGGNHFVHFIANDRTVVSRNLDGRLGIGYFGEEGDRVFHACVFGDFLNNHVNQERTGFTFDDHLLDGIVNEVCMPHIEHFLADALEEQSEKQRKSIAEIVSTYPSISFGTVEELQKYVPTGESSLDGIYGHLSRQRFRRDKRQSASIQAAFRQLKGDRVNASDFYTTVQSAVEILEEAETKSLAEYVVRRKAVLDFLDLLLAKIRLSEIDSSYQTESLLHSMICPMRVSTVGDEKRISAAASHELWIIDERLTFAQYFSSDVPFSELGAAFDSEDRADVLVFNTAHSLRQSDESSRVLIVEFKRPGRTAYRDDENPALQVERYVRLLQEGGKLDVRGRPIKLPRDVVFHCFIVADIIGKLDDWTYSWEHVASTGGRRMVPRSGFQGSIELIGWDSLLADAKSRNHALIVPA